MSRQSHPSHRRPARPLAFAVALCATLAAAPGHAIDVPDLPLQTGAAYPPANVMFILDDSGSMEWRYMYNPRIPRIRYVDRDGDNDSSRPTGDNIRYDASYGPFSNSHAEGVYDRSYVTNTIYYNPSVTYLTWMQADGTRMSGGTTYSSVYTSDNHVGGDTANLSSVGEPATFYVPVSDDLSDSELGELENYYRFQILPNGEVWRASFQYSNKSASQCDGGNAKGWRWRDCQRVTPTGRSEAAERNNFATWYSYHRTRIKVAKAGASEAFGQLGSGIRVGYDSIWGRNTYKIPVTSDGGVFRGSNRSTWFSRLQSAAGNNGTPLKGALQRAGKYFSDAGTGGPWDAGDGTLLSCRQNFAILTTDGYWNSDSGYDGKIGDSDSKAGELIVSEDGKTSLQYKPVPPYRDDFESRWGSYSRGDTLADIANYYWKRDLVDTLANDVPTSTADPAFWQHMVTFGVSIGLQGRLDPKQDLQAITNGSKHWGDPTDDEDLDRIDDLWHAAVNGHGNFVSASSPDEFVQGLIDALATVAQRLGSASNVTANSTSFQTDTRVYQASYVSGKWTGELAAYEVSSAGVSSKDADGDGVPDAAWKASQHIPAYGKRSIYTSTATGVGKGAEFPTAAQTTALDQSSRLAVNGGPTTGAENAAYVAGSQAMEVRQGGLLRDRDTLLGDIANSSPMYVHDNEMIYVGANDGMLHAFSAVDRDKAGKVVGGQEMFAYVPAGIDFAALATLSDPQYGPNHRYFVDGPVVVSSQAQTGSNYLVATLGRGGKGLFALDVTEPDKFDAGDVLWDLTGGALGGDMGQVLGEPLIVTLNDAAATQAVVVGNGINSGNGHAVLFVLDIDTGAVIAKFDTGAGGDNGLSAPRGADTNGDGKVDYIYAGDLKGNVWKFDLSGDTTGAWAIANSGSALFTATDEDGKAQPITSGLAIARDPSTGRIWVFAGTGRFIESGDVGSDDVQTMYGLIDDGTAIAGRGSLVERKIVVTGTAGGKNVRGFEAAGSMPAGKRGWYIDLGNPEAGERVVSNPRVRGTVLLFASMVPPKADTCDAGGTGYVNALDAFSGTSLGVPFFDVNDDGDYDDDDKLDTGGSKVPVGSVDLGVGMPTLPTLIEELLVVGGSRGTLGSISMNPQGGAARRISWREILGD
ncbi:MAG TPA: PilC/PilY family type IV pilus protein [Luteimonas sp.]|nr:PilC/PilY family type IV pilus protein [Luteimonas sp.]